MFRTRGQIIALLSLIAYALHSPLMMWELGITMHFCLGFTDFTEFLTCAEDYSTGVYTRIFESRCLG